MMTDIKRMVVEEVISQLKEIMSRPGGKEFRRGPYGGATTDTMADIGVKHHQAMSGEIKMKLEFIKTIRDSFNPNSSEFRLAQDILDNCLDRMSPPTPNQLDLLAKLYAKKKHEGVALKAKFPMKLTTELSPSTYASAATKSKAQGRWGQLSKFRTEVFSKLIKKGFVVMIDSQIYKLFPTPQNFSAEDNEIFVGCTSRALSGEEGPNIHIYYNIDKDAFFWKDQKASGQAPIDSLRISRNSAFRLTALAKALNTQTKVNVGSFNILDRYVDDDTKTQIANAEKDASVSENEIDYPHQQDFYHPEAEDERCPWCGDNVQLKHGTDSKGQFISCGACGKKNYTEPIKEEFDNWVCMECHYRSPKRFSRCPKCSSGEIENLG